MQKKSSFIIIGNGWRADFYHRIARALPDEFEIKAVVTRTEEKAEQIKREKNVPATNSLEKALETNPDFAVLCVHRDGMYDYLEALFKENIPVLCETPPSNGIEGMRKLWKSYQKYNGQMQVAEQYFLQPIYSGIDNIIQSGLLGEISSMTLSALHEYHAVSIFRKLMNADASKCRIRAKRYVAPVMESGSRDGADLSGKVVQRERIMAVFEFENQKTAFYDFADGQYHSKIRTRRLNIQGERGEINDFEVRYIDENHEAMLSNIVRIDNGIFNNNGLNHVGLMMNGKYIYRNPFPNIGFDDDEIAVAHCMRKMAVYVGTKEEFYSLRDGIIDGYLGYRLLDALKSGEEEYCNIKEVFD